MGWAVLFMLAFVIFGASLIVFAARHGDDGRGEDDRDEQNL